MTQQDHDTRAKRLGDIRREAQDALAEIQSAFDRVFDACDAVGAQTQGNARVTEELSRIYEAGAIQDVVRQRLEKIARIVARIEDPSLPEDDPLLAGPQTGDADRRQEEINRLLKDSD